MRSVCQYPSPRAPSSSGVAGIQTATVYRNRSSATRNRAIDAAHSILEQEDVLSVTHASVSVKIGISRSTLFRHWPDVSEMRNDLFKRATTPPKMAPATTSPSPISHCFRYSRGAATWSPKSQKALRMSTDGSPTWPPAAVCQRVCASINDKRPNELQFAAQNGKMPRIL